MTVLLDARSVTYCYPSSHSPAIRDVVLEVHEGEAVGVVGESGSGKSTLARVLVGLAAPTSGASHVQERDWATVGRKDPLRRRVQMIFQDPISSLNPSMTALDTVAEVAQVWFGMRRGAARGRAAELLAEMGVDRTAMGRKPRALSGGQAQRVGIARALAAEPDVLVADEPTSALDVSVQAQIMNILQGLRRSRKLALVLITHDLNVMQLVTDRAIVMYQGRVVEEGATRALIDAPTHPYTQLLVDSIPGRPGEIPIVSRALAEPGRGCVFAPRCPKMTDRCLAAEPSLSPFEDRGVACYHPSLEPARAADGSHV